MNFKKLFSFRNPNKVQVEDKHDYVSSFDLRSCFAGKKVISIGNGFEVEDEPDNSVKTGTVTNFSEMHGKLFPIVDFGTGEEFLCMSAIVLWTQELEDILSKLTAEERYRFCMAFANRFSSFQR